jgi:N-acetylglucosaminyldiphosphoundecaprenol N-acetyl-beta-D-mannosaminyltransferase
LSDVSQTGGSETSVGAVPTLGVYLAAQRYDAAIARFVEAAANHRQLRAHFCTVHSLVEAHANASLREVFASAEMVAMDGMPLVWLARLRGARHAERVCGPDVMLSLCDVGRDIGLRHFFMGGQAGVPEALASRLAAMYPGLEVVGTESPPFRAMSPEEVSAMVNRINAAAPHALWIGLGSPKQEFWAAEHEDRLSVPLILPVGAAFDFHSGRLRRAPRWMQRLGLEWLFRLAAEPRRLFRRYVITNSRFIYLVAREEIARRR